MYLLALLACISGLGALGCDCWSGNSSACLSSVSVVIRPDSGTLNGKSYRITLATPTARHTATCLLVPQTCTWDAATQAIPSGNRPFAFFRSSEVAIEVTLIKQTPPMVDVTVQVDDRPAVQRLLTPVYRVGDSCREDCRYALLPVAI